jgi:hypothetical protein
MAFAKVRSTMLCPPHHHRKNDLEKQTIASSIMHAQADYAWAYPPWSKPPYPA